ncbi:disulfide oxidoreductase [Bacillus tianshenii]|nr:disulfide oxidoreductase [Bacillus tianshenii]
MRRISNENNLILAWIAALTATGGSLYFSEVMQYIPCELCWYQRILMYPIVLILGMAIVRKDYKASIYALLLSGIGLVISIYHYLIQMVPAFQEKGGSCSLVPCNSTYIQWFGFITIPFLAMTAFIIIIAATFSVWRNERSK